LHHDRETDNFALPAQRNILQTSPLAVDAESLFLAGEIKLSAGKALTADQIRLFSRGRGSGP
jgi:hypothetical protein